MQTQQKTSIEAINDEWFDEFIHTLRTHQLQLQTQTASEEMVKMYEILSSGNTDKIMKVGKDLAQQHFVRKIIIDYFIILSQELPNKLALDYDDSKVLIWAEINSEDELLERKLILAEAKINAKYHEFGFDMATTIVEDTDYLEVPSHYTVFK